MKKTLFKYWDDHPNFPSEDWRYEVANNSTRLGYWAWVSVKKGDPDEDLKWNTTKGNP